MEKISLKKQLNDWIQRDNFVSHTAIKKSCEDGSFGRYYKIGTAERRLRPSESPFVAAVMRGNYIEGYQWKEPPKVEKKYRLEQVGNTAHFYKEQVLI